MAEESQSLFYWNPFCNAKTAKSEGYISEVAILILLESFLQYDVPQDNQQNSDLVAILILLESFLQ